MSEDRYNDLLWQAFRKKKSPALEAMREEAMKQYIYFLEALTKKSEGRPAELEFIQNETVVGIMRETYVKAYITCMLAHNIPPGLTLLPPGEEQ